MSSGEPSASTVCQICNNIPSKYCCPRCSILFCSLGCYKSEAHVDCSETFYRECVTEQLSSQSVDDNSRQKMMEILNRLNSEIDCALEDDDRINENDDASIDSDDNPDAVELAERLKDVNLDDSESVWHALTRDEKKEFESLLQSGKVLDMLPVWKPWWIYNKKSKLIQEIGHSKPTNTDERNNYAQCPVIMANISEFHAISNQNPAECVKYNLMNVLSAYLYTVRLFNGEHLSTALEAISCFLSVCNNMKDGANFDDAFSAVESVIQECHIDPLMIADDTNVENMRFDIISLLRGPESKKRTFYVNSALSDLHRLLAEAKSQSNIPHSTSAKDAFSTRFPDRKFCHLTDLTPAKLRSYMKKVEYYLSFVKSYSADVTTALFGFEAVLT